MGKTVSAAAGKAEREGRVSSKAASSVEGAVADAFEILVNNELVSYRDINAYAGTDLDVVASRIAVEVTFALSEQIDALNVYSSDFRMSLHRLARWMLVNLVERKESCVVVPDAIPGFTCMDFKRAAFDLKGRPVEFKAPCIDSGSVERHAATLIMERFLSNSKGQVVVVECRDVLLVLFPVADLRSNLLRLGFLGSD